MMHRWWSPVPVCRLALAIIAVANQAAAEVKDDTIERNPNELVTVFEDRGILTSQRRVILEPSLSFSSSTNTLVAIEGLTIVPALVIGLINVSQIQRDVTTAAMSARVGITPRFEVGIKVPYLSVNQSVRERSAFDSSSVDIVNNSSGSGLGDAELTLSYQLNDSSRDGVSYVTSLRIKSDSGKSPFEIERREVMSEDGTQKIGEVFVEQPTGTGFWAVQPGITVIYPSDPAVLYGGLSYMVNVKDDKGPEFGRTIDPGDVLGVNFGMGFAINDRTSFSLGYDHNVIYKTTIENDNNLLDASFDIYHSGSFLVGMSHILNRSTSFNLTLGIGVTDIAPDMQVTFRMPFSI